MSLLLLLNPTVWGTPGAPATPFVLGPALPRLSDVEVWLIPPGSEPRRLTPEVASMRWTSAAVGGFGSLQMSLPGYVTKQELPYLSIVRVTLGPRVLWEGRIEDLEWTI